MAKDVVEKMTTINHIVIKKRWMQIKLSCKKFSDIEAYYLIEVKERCN